MNTIATIILTATFTVPVTILICQDVTVRKFMDNPTGFVEKLKHIAYSRGWK